jgi:hypothetical protein
MVMRLVADKRDELPEPLRESASERSGQWFADLGNFSVEDVTGLKSTVVAKNERIKKLEGQLRGFGWVLAHENDRWSTEGVDPAAAREAVEKIRSGSLKGSDEIERYKQSLNEKIGADRQRMESGLKKVLDKLRQAMVLEPIRAAIKEHGGSVSLLAPVIEKSVRVDVDDEYNVSVALLNEQGKPMLSKKTGSMEPMSFDEFVQDLRKHPEYRAAFAGNGVGGAGTASQGGGAARVARGAGDVTMMSPRELIDRGNAYSTTRTA